LVANSSYTEEYLMGLTIPQLNMRYEDVLRYKIGFHGMIGDDDMRKAGKPDREHTVADALAFVKQFAGIGG